MKLKYTVEVKEEVHASHQLSLPYESKCNRQHGHTYRIGVILTSVKLNGNGMVVDFSAVKEIIRKYDHAHLNDFFNPSTAENFAFHLFRDIQSGIPADVFVECVTVRETAKNTATIERVILPDYSA